MKKSAPRKITPLARVSGKRYELIGFTISGSQKLFKTKQEAKDYAKKRDWRIVT